MPTPKEWLERIREISAGQHVRVLNVCGGHERTISKAGVRAVMPEGVELIPGPGCPVCVCPEEDIFAAIELAQRPDVTLVAFGDMLHVPANVPKRMPRSLQAVKDAGADVRPIASPQEALRIARDSPEREVVFFAAGFETTMAPVASLMAEGVPDNLSILLAGRRTWPAVAMLLESEAPGFDALVAPGHVATIMGANEWRFVVDQHNVPAAVAGFHTESLLSGIYSAVRQYVEGRPFLDNCYGEVVRPEGNACAQDILNRVMDVVPANWRGIGEIPASGYSLKPDYAAHDARLRFAVDPAEDRKRAGQMPPGCDCARVVLGKIYPDECALYGKACTPRNPVGPCMVSDEGACRIWWSSGIRTQREREPA
ncbi:hydrogenase formation protein HypD [Dichotomicrobium thermohalophilum]|uniref:Hydrogenase maturation factor n=1 Tax=Dichotomicrobium thermohalophilum TaxID=933063 RepID=A0A397Q5D5_9HYPH|nr:hydrogenase formation protein HypD [Dichotomicrobium thermohalophilum]RIA56163.1 hydrogenase maturation protein HypD [Dichotomicrobium thermohalophilum]